MFLILFLRWCDTTRYLNTYNNLQRINRFTKSVITLDNRLKFILTMQNHRTFFQSSDCTIFVFFGFNSIFISFKFNPSDQYISGYWCNSTWYIQPNADTNKYAFIPRTILEFTPKDNRQSRGPPTLQDAARRTPAVHLTSRDLQARYIRGPTNF